MGAGRLTHPWVLCVITSASQQPSREGKRLSQVEAQVPCNLRLSWLGRLQGTWLPPCVLAPRLAPLYFYRASRWKDFTAWFYL